MRVKITLSYDGSRFEGFQKQNHTSNTVANKLYEVLESMGIEEKIVASGRTDKGVHATNQICHIDLPTYWKDLKYLQKHINSKISNIYIKKIEKTTDDFHARFSAKRRVYRYIISTKKEKPFFRKLYNIC
jgi:tRNA pseudouridine38-40 synthase